MTATLVRLVTSASSSPRGRATRMPSRVRRFYTFRTRPPYRRPPKTPGVAGCRVRYPKPPTTSQPVRCPGSPGGMALVGRRSGRLDAADQQFELGDLVLECGLAGLGEGDPGAGAFSGVALLDGDEPGGFQHAKVLGQVACGQP